MLSFPRRLSVITMILREATPEKDRKQLAEFLASGGAVPKRDSWGMTADAEADQNALLSGALGGVA